jgi:hypothetical protein
VIAFTPFGAAMIMSGSSGMTAEGRFMARTTGNADFAADVRLFDDRERAAQWLSGAVEGVRPRTRRATP